MNIISSILISIVTCSSVESFTPLSFVSGNCNRRCAIDVDSRMPLFATVETGAPTGFIERELRGAAMDLHTRSQAPTEGKVQEVERKPHVTTLDDYLHFLVDSQHVYSVFEEIVRIPELSPEMTAFVDTGLERTGPLEMDIEFIVKEYGMIRPPVGEIGMQYAGELQELAGKSKDGIPELVCHYYNHYFAHTAGGRMIGKQMSNLLLDKKTLEFYKWDGDLKKIKTDVKNSIEELAASWSREQKDLCVGATAAAFQGGGMLNAYLMGVHSRS